MKEKTVDSSENIVDRVQAKSFEDLIVWQNAHQLVLEIYKITKDFPSEEKFALVSQMRRSAVSVPANIAEGFRKRGIRDKLNYYNIAQGSLDELNYYIILSKDLGYIQTNKHLLEQIKEVAKLLSGLIKSIGGKR
ncbi:MAG TPA: four helix bundle protein [Defluviitoga tunisiensis]|nr:four helix bundle protein [Defluviitoga tunisiensis]